MGRLEIRGSGTHATLLLVVDTGLSSRASAGTGQFGVLSVLTRYRAMVTKSWGFPALDSTLNQLLRSGALTIHLLPA